MKEQREEERRGDEEESTFTQGTSGGRLLSPASPVALAGSCCTATVTRVTRLLQLGSMVLAGRRDL